MKSSSPVVRHVDVSAPPPAPVIETETSVSRQRRCCLCCRLLCGTGTSVQLEGLSLECTRQCERTLRLSCPRWADEVLQVRFAASEPCDAAIMLTDVAELTSA